MAALTDEQQATRKRGIGSSDIAAVVGLNPWRGPLSVWLEKTGRADSIPSTKSTQLGQVMEPIVANWYAEARHVVLVPGETTVRDEWKVATPDFSVCDPIEALLEVKLVGARMALKWPDEGVPDYVLAQVLWQMHVTGIEKADVAVFLGGTEFRIESIPASPRLLDDMVRIGEHFWTQYVVRDVAPPIDASTEWTRYLAKQWPKDLAPMQPATREAEAIAHRLAEARRTRKAAESREEQAENELKALIGDASGIATETWAATWRLTKSGGVDYKGLATELGATAELLAKYTRAGVRRFVFKDSTTEDR